MDVLREQVTVGVLKRKCGCMGTYAIRDLFNCSLTVFLCCRVAMVLEARLGTDRDSACRRLREPRETDATHHHEFKKKKGDCKRWGEGVPILAGVKEQGGDGRSGAWPGRGNWEWEDRA